MRGLSVPNILCLTNDVCLMALICEEALSVGGTAESDTAESNTAESVVLD